MKETTSTVVINDTKGIWPGWKEENSREFSTECIVDGDISLDMYCMEDALLYREVFCFEKAPILLALKATEERVLLAFQFHDDGWHCAPLICADPRSLQDTGEMKLCLYLSDDQYSFEREEVLPEEFATVLRRALRENGENVKRSGADDYYDPLDVVNDPDVACVIPYKRKRKSENK